MAEITLVAQERTDFGKGAARRLRRDKLIPAVMYGHGGQPIHIALPAHATTLALRTANALLDIELAGQASRLALPKAIQRNPVRDTIEHVDLIIVRRGEKVHVEVPLVVVGEVKGEAVVLSDQSSIMLEVEATRIPPYIEIDISTLEIGDAVYAKDLILPEGARFPGDPDDLMLSVQAPQAKDLGEVTAEAEAEAGESEETTEE